MRVEEAKVCQECSSAYTRDQRDGMYNDVDEVFENYLTNIRWLES